jgi:acyl-CoA thioesterase-1
MRLFLVSLLAILSFAACKDQKPPAPSLPTGPAILILGDSLTAGFGLPKDRAFPALLEERFKKEGVALAVVNGGLSGDTTSGGLSRLPWFLSRKDLDLKAIVIELGNNDAMRGKSAASVEKNITEMIHLARKERPGIQIFLCDLHTFPNMGKQYVAEFKAVFPRIAKKEKVVLLPFLLTGVAGKPELNQKDGIHPTEEGAAIVAENLYRALKPHLR